MVRLRVSGTSYGSGNSTKAVLYKGSRNGKTFRWQALNRSNLSRLLLMRLVLLANLGDVGLAWGGAPRIWDICDIRRQLCTAPFLSLDVNPKLI